MTFIHLGTSLPLDLARSAAHRSTFRPRIVGLLACTLALAALASATRAQAPRLSKVVAAGTQNAMIILPNGRTRVLVGSNAMALLADGTVRMWGYNGHYSMGLGHNREYPRGLQTVKLQKVVSIASGWNASYFVLQDGAVLKAGTGPMDGYYRVPTVNWPKWQAERFAEPDGSAVPGVPPEREVTAGAAIIVDAARDLSPQRCLVQ